MPTLIAAVTAVVSALFLGIAAVADQRSTKKIQARGALSPRIMLDLVRQPLWLAAVGANVVGFALQVVALSFGSLALVQPLLVFDLVFAVLISWYLRKRDHVRRPGGTRADLAMFAGVAAAAAGVAGFLAIGQPSGGQTHASFAILPPLLTGLVVVVGGCLLAGSRNRTLQPLATALACGVCYGVAAFSIKLVTSEFHGPAELFGDWPIYILVVVGPVGYLLNQDAFQEGTFLAPVQAIITSADPVISIGLGILWLEVHVRNSPAAVAGEVVSLLVMVAGIVVTAQHAPQVAGSPGKAAAGAAVGRAAPQLPGPRRRRPGAAPGGGPAAADGPARRTGPRGGAGYAGVASVPPEAGPVGGSSPAGGVPGPSAAVAARLSASSSSRRGPYSRRNVRCARARSRMATSSWAAASSDCAPFPGDEPDDPEDGAARAASAAPRASVSDIPSENRSFSAAATWSACPPKATNPGSSVTEPSNVIR
jgi:drug/metabolite transporter (DMT)-like permease